MKIKKSSRGYFLKPYGKFWLRDKSVQKVALPFARRAAGDQNEMPRISSRFEISKNNSFRNAFFVAPTTLPHASSGSQGSSTSRR